MHTKAKIEHNPDKATNETCIALTGIILVLKNTKTVYPDEKPILQGLNQVGGRYNWGQVFHTQIKSGKFMKAAMFIPLVNNGRPIEFEELSECDEYITGKSRKARSLENVAKAFSKLPGQFRMHVESVQTGTALIGCIPVGTQYEVEK